MLLFTGLSMAKSYGSEWQMADKYSSYSAAFPYIRMNSFFLIRKDQLYVY